MLSNKADSKAAVPSQVKSGKKVDDFVDDFRGAIRAIAVEVNKSIKDLFRDTFEKKAIVEGEKKYLTHEIFEAGAFSLRSIREKFSKSELYEIFEECDVSQSKRITIDELADFTQRTISKARILALKLRTAIMEECAAEENVENAYRQLFSSISKNNAKYVVSDAFRNFIEDFLEISLSESEELGIYTLFDIDGDGKLSADDFLGFIQGQSAEAIRALDPGNGEVIVDIKVSSTTQQDLEYANSGYEQVVPDFGPVGRPDNFTLMGTFGKGQSMWIWRRKQGTCSGRLKPVVDIKIQTSAITSSAFALSGYVCLAVQCSGQWVWIKRARTEDDEKDAIVDIKVTWGNKRDQADKIWTSPGVGWIRVEANFNKKSVLSGDNIFFSHNDSFLWFRPSRTRSLETHMFDPVRAAVTLTSEVRQETVFLAVRTAIRHHIPLSVMKRLNPSASKSPTDGATLAVKQSASTAVPVTHSIFLFDFTTLYHQYNERGDNKLSPSKFTKMLFDIGLHLDKEDLNYCFHSFNIKQDNYISREEFCMKIGLCDYDLDLIIDKIRKKLLFLANDDSRGGTPAPGGGSFVNSGAKAGESDKKGGGGADSTKNTIRQNRRLSQIFKLIEMDNNNILTTSEIQELCGRLEIFVTEEEARKIRDLMDLDCNDIITESDFIGFMKKSSQVIVRKAERLRSASISLRRWLLQGTNDKTAASDKEWREFKKRHEACSGRKFPDFIAPEDLVFTLTGNGLNIFLAPQEGRELALIVAPDAREKKGKIQQPDLHKFMGSKCRTFGELMNLMARDLMKPVIDLYKKHRESLQKDGIEDVDLADAYQNKVKEIVRAVQKDFLTVPAAAPGGNTGGGASTPGGGGVLAAQDTRGAVVSGFHDVVSVAQLKLGIEYAMRESYKTPEAQLPVLEEYACLACYVGAAVAEEDVYGIKIKNFIEGICVAAVGDINVVKADDKITVDMLCRELQRMILEEARQAGKGRKLDFVAAYNLFDEDGNGKISLEEFRKTLVRLQVIDQLPESQIPALLGMFDPKKKGYITVDDFLKFVDSNKSLDDDFDDLDSDDDLGLDGLTSASQPPVPITRDHDCNWLIWHLWKQCCKIEPSDGEGVVNELEAQCADTSISSLNDGSITLKGLWDILVDMKLVGYMTRQQFDKGCLFLALDGSCKDNDTLDFYALCRYTVRMGRAYYQSLEEKNKVDEENYKKMRAALKKELMSMGGATPTLGKDGKPTEKADPPRYEKVFRRLDGDGDGHITMQELKLGLKRLRVKDVKLWNMRMVARLFKDLDISKDGVVSVKEFTVFIQTPEPKDGEKEADVKRSLFRREQGELEAKAQGYGAAGAGDDDNEEDIFARGRLLNDNALFQKASEALQSLIPLAGSSTETHIEIVRATIRKFFQQQKADPENRGLVSEDAWRLFCRKSNLLEALSAAEVRRLTEKLRRRRPASMVQVASKDVRNVANAKQAVANAGYVIDYEKLCKHIGDSYESVPHSQAEIILMKLQDAVSASAALNKHFVHLCSIVDARQRGTLTKEQLIVTIEMLCLTLSGKEIDALREILPPGIVQENGTFDYIELNNFVQNHTPRHGLGAFGSGLDDSFVLNSSFDRRYALGRSGALPAYASPGVATPLNHFMPSPVVHKPHPAGYLNQLGRPPLARPQNHTWAGGAAGAADFVGNFGPEANHHLSAAVIDRILSSISERVLTAVRSKHSYSTPYSLRHQFQLYEVSPGWIATTEFIKVLQDINVALDTTDLQVLRKTFGTHTDFLDYEAFMTRCCPKAATAITEEQRPTGSDPVHPFAGTSGYIDLRVLQKLDDLKTNGRGQDPRDLFQGHDIDGYGIVTEREFRQVVVETGLLSTQHQLTKAIDAHRVINARNMINYEDFCRTLEEALAAKIHAKPPPRRHHTQTVYNSQLLFDDDDDNPLIHRGIGRPLSAQVADRDYQWNTAPARDFTSRFPNNLDEGSVGDWDAAFAPKLQESFDYPDRSNRNHKHHLNRSFELERDRDRDRDYLRDSDGEFGRTSRSSFGMSARRADLRESGDFDRWRTHGDSLSPKRSVSRERDRYVDYRDSLRSSLSMPRISPSKVAPKIWGKDVPLGMKGKPPKTTPGTWCCTVCYYLENAYSCSTCAMCDSPNIHDGARGSRDFQAMEQCAHCTQLNGQYAENCEYCGMTLSNGYSSGRIRIR